ncbi:MAG TPA: DUF2279 domain-containing protein [Flavitalea sp.]|nr:DUF2279 domain-containing protein [Flavitalea sp.]
MFILFSLQSFILTTFARGDTLSPSFLSNKKMVIVAAANVAFYTSSFILLNRAWYQDYDKTNFHFFNDNPEWNQVDKAGHVWTTYHISRLSNEMWKWAGLNKTTSAVLGAASGLVYQSIIEIQDAYSAEWGFSCGDVGADVTGASLFALQELIGNQQKISLKLSYRPKRYPINLVARRNQLFGSSFTERILKDYNSQTYWLSANISSLFPRSNAPRWLNVAFGYGADGMFGGRSNEWTDKDGIAHNYNRIRRVRKFYLSPDVDLTMINTRNKVLKKVFFVLNMVKVPAPALLVDTGDKLKITFR